MRGRTRLNTHSASEAISAPPFPPWPASPEPDNRRWFRMPSVVSGIIVPACEPHSTTGILAALLIWAQRGDGASDKETPIAHDKDGDRCCT
jgi:hypothetical protein